MDQKVLDVVHRFCTTGGQGASPRDSPRVPAPAAAPPARDTDTDQAPRGSTAARTACRRVTATAPSTGGIIDVWYGRRWAVVACNDGLGGEVRVFPSLKIAHANFD